MKNLILLLLFIIMMSCKPQINTDGTSTFIPEEETTIAILNEIDTFSTYYIVVKDQTINAINTETMLLEYKVVDYRWESDFLSIVILIILIMMLIISVILK